MMSGINPRTLKFKVSPNFVSQTQDDGEEVPPPCMSRDRPSYLGPDPLARKKMEIEAESKSDESSTTSDSTNVHKPKSSSSNWLSRISRKECKKKLKEVTDKFELARLKKRKKLGPGVYVYTRDSRIAPLEDKPRPGYTRCRRIKYEGTIIKASMYYDHVWLVVFNDGKQYMCSEGLLHFISKTSPTHRLCRNENNKLVYEKIDKNYEDRELILSTILSSKINYNTGHEDVTYDTLVRLFKPQHKWLTASKLRKYVSISRRSLSINTTTQATAGTWLAELPLEDEEDTKKSAGSDIPQDENPKKPQDDTNKSTNDNSRDDESEEDDITGRNHKDNDDDDSVNPSSGDDEDSVDTVENHGLACTCCGIRASIVTKSDFSQAVSTKAITGCDAMVTKITICADGTRSVCTQIVPSKKRMSDADREYQNLLNKKNGDPRRFDKDGKLYYVKEGYDEFVGDDRSDTPAPIDDPLDYPNSVTLNTTVDTANSLSFDNDDDNVVVIEKPPALNESENETSKFYVMQTSMYHSVYFSTYYICFYLHNQYR